MAYPVVEWIKQTSLMNTSTFESSPSIVSDSSGNIYGSYQTAGTISGGTFLGTNDIVVFKMDTNGNMVWIKQQAVMNSTGGDQFPTISIDSSGNVYVTYYTTETVSGGTFLGGTNDIVVLKMDTNGNMVWIKQQELMNSTGNDQYPTISVDSFGNVYVSYQAQGTVSGGTHRGGTFDIVVFKLDTNGNMVWIKQQAVMNSTGNDQYPTISTDSSGNVYVTYYTTGTVSGGTFLGGTNDIVVSKLDTNGNVIWIKQQRVMNSTGNDQYPTISTDSSGNIYVTYQTNGTVSGGTNRGGIDIVVFKMDTNGNMVWIRERAVMNSGFADQLPSIAVDTSGNIYVSYNTAGSVSGGITRGSNDIAIFKMDTNGNIVWTIQEPLFNTSGLESSSKLIVDISGNIYVSYYTTGTVSGGTFLGGTGDTVLVKLQQTNLMNPPSISSIAISLYNNAAVNVLWLSKNGASSIKVYRDTQASGATKTFLGTSSGYFYYDNDNNVISGTTYYYFISGMFGSTETSLSSGVAFTYTAPSVSLSWIKQMSVMNSTLNDQYPTISTDSSGNIYVTYQTNGTVSGGTNRGGIDIVVFKMDTNGNIVWIKQQALMSTPINDLNPTISTDSSGNVYVAYQTSGTISGGTFLGAPDIVLFKMDTNGNMEWIKQQALMNTISADYVPQISTDLSGNIYVTYQTQGTLSGGTFLGIDDIVVFKMDTNGNMVWIKQQAVMNTTDTDKYPTISTDSFGNVYVSYYTSGTVSGGTFLGGFQDIVVFKMDTNGNMVWIKQQALMNSTGNDQYPTISTDSSGNVYVTYYTTGTVSGGTFLGGTNDIVVFKMDTNGNMVWIKQQAVMNSTGNDQLPTISTDSSGNVYVTYQINGTVSGGIFTGTDDIVVFKMDTNGNLVWIKQEGILNTSGNDSLFTPKTNAVDSSGNIYLTYQTSGTVSGGTFLGSNDIVVAKYLAPTAPGAPTAVSAVAGNAQAVVNFTAPANNGGSVITSYTVTSSPGNITASGAASPITVTGLTNGTAYTFTVTATNAIGTSVASSPSSSVTPSAGPSVPDAPTGVTATAKSLSALVSWTEPANGGSAITSYTITPYQGASPVSASITTVQGAANTSSYVYGLANGTAYTFTVTATNAIGTSSASAASSSITPASDASTNAVVAGPTAITNYVAAASATTQTEQADLSISMRVSLNAGTNGGTTQQKVDAKVAYIDSMRSKVGASSFTIPQAKFTEFLATLITRTTDTLTPKPITAYVPQYTSQSATVDVSSASSANYVQFEVPIGYTVILQNGAASLSLTYNGTNYSDGTNTYAAGAIIVLGDKTLTLVGIGSGILDVLPTNQIVCFRKGSMIQTSSGVAAIETLRTGDNVVTGDGRIVPITSMKQIVVVAADEQNAPYVIEKDAFGKNCPPNRLEVSPRHAVQLSSGFWEIPCEAAKENKRVYQNKATLGKQVVYYHFSLPNYATDTTIVNGQITETLNDGKYRESYVLSKEHNGYKRTVRNVTVVTKK